DPKLDAWHILWTDPLNQVYRQQIGRARGNDIVQEGTDDTGAPVRWSFTEITSDSFRWLGERSPDGGTSFRLLVEFLARRQPAGAKRALCDGDNRLAANQPRQLAQPRKNPLAIVSREPPGQSQLQAAALDHHRRVRQHARHGRGGDVSDPHGGAE